MEYLGFQLDPFQERAVHSIDAGHSLIIAAPTGCGKTLIAEYAVDVSLAQGRRVVYTAPIKSLSNQKFRDLRRRFGEQRVGIHTGDVTMNADAPVLIMTTEIFRNIILERSGRLDDVHYAVFDEIHYLDDRERGTVWEECLILAPAHIRCLCLSATVPNIRELAAWMSAVRGSPFDVIEEYQRPVPLRHFLYSSRHGVVSLSGLRQLYKRGGASRRRLARARPSARKLLRMVLQRRQVPALYFCFNRRGCERNAEMYAGENLVNGEERNRIVELVERLVGQYRLGDYERLAHMRSLWECGCGYHHAGMLPAAKEIVEQLFTAGLLKLLFCTETFALGINMPARTVVIDELEKFDGVDVRYLMTRTYHQIAGRAGRRGMDAEGFVYAQIVPELTDPREVERILYGKNERINSRFVASYSTILTLYSQFGDGAFDIFRKSLRNYHGGQFAISGGYEREEGQIRARVKFLQAGGFLAGQQLTEKGRLAAAVNGYEIQAAELHYSRSLDECSPAQLAVVLAGLVTEESSRTRRAGRGGSVLAVRFSSGAEKVIRELRRREQRSGIASPVPEMDFAYAGLVYSWAGGCSLNDLLSYGVPEGDIIRVMRMTVQLLRTLRESLPDPEIAGRMHQALQLVNRDVVDAQAELRVG